jgi:hypothetical protein
VLEFPDDINIDSLISDDIEADLTVFAEVALTNLSQLPEIMVMFV